MRYWIYAHDSSGEIVLDLGNWRDLHLAIATVIDTMPGQDFELTYRIVDDKLGQSVWIAGPVHVQERIGGNETVLVHDA